MIAFLGLLFGVLSLGYLISQGHVVVGVIMCLAFVVSGVITETNRNN